MKHRMKGNVKKHWRYVNAGQKFTTVMLDNPGLKDMYKSFIDRKDREYMEKKAQEQRIKL